MSRIPKAKPGQMATAITMLTGSNLGLVLTSSNKQLAAGTLQFHDPLEPGVKYTLYANGYYRKFILTAFGGVPRNIGGAIYCYQLNRTKQTPSKWGGTSTERILIPGEYVLMAQRIIPICRKSRAKYTGPVRSIPM